MDMDLFRYFVFLFVVWLVFVTSQNRWWISTLNGCRLQCTVHGVVEANVRRTKMGWSIDEDKRCKRFAAIAQETEWVHCEECIQCGRISSSTTNMRAKNAKKITLKCVKRTRICVRFGANLYWRKTFDQTRGWETEEGNENKITNSSIAC